MGEEPLRHAASARSSVACIVTEQGRYPTAKRQTARRARKMVADAAGRAGRPAGAGLDSNNKGRAVLFMALLALQIGVQPVIVKTCIDKLQVALVSVVVGQELLKLVIAFFMLQIECRGQLRAVLDGSSMRESVKLGALPSFIFFTLLIQTIVHPLKSKAGLMVARAAALRVKINIDGRPFPTQKRWRTSSKACAPHLLHACARHFHLPVK